MFLSVALNVAKAIQHDIKFHTHKLNTESLFKVTGKKATKILENGVTCVYDKACRLVCSKYETADSSFVSKGIILSGWMVNTLRGRKWKRSNVERISPADDVVPPLLLQI